MRIGFSQVLTWAGRLALWLVFSLPVQALPSFDEVRQAHHPSDTLILDRQGEPIHRLRTDTRIRRGNWVNLADVSPALRTALVLSEDKRFYEHSGVDWQAVSAAAWGNLWHQRTRGASTITMQLAGLLDVDWRAGASGRTLSQKLGQTLAAQALERHWRKDQILEAYLNTLPFRGELVGIDALSQNLFGKAPHGLNLRESALAAVLVRAPNAPLNLLAQRACALEKTLGEVAADCQGVAAFAAVALSARSYLPSEGIAPHLAQHLLAQAPATADRRIASTLSAGVQRFATASLHRHLRELRGRQVEDGAVVVLDNASGEVLAWVSAAGPTSQTSQVDRVTAMRQPGSTLKPFLYAQAFAERRLSAASLLEDASTQIATGSGLYIPQNYDHQFKGWVSARTALAASLNVPAVRTLVMVSPEAFAQQLQRLGLPLRHTGDYYGYSLALGSAEVSLLNLTNAYRTLANGGRAGGIQLQPWPASRAPRPPPASHAVLDPQAAFIVGDILSDPQARARTFGSDSVLATRFWSAVKTGTSKDMRDNWALGYSRRYTVGVWVGNASGAAMHGVSGTSGAAPVWAAVMAHLHATADGSAGQSPPAPAGLQRGPVRFGSALEADRQEWFLPGTLQTFFAIDCIACNVGNASQNGLFLAKILSPSAGTILALDPDLPPRHQRLTLSASPLAPAHAAQLRWWVDGKALARGATAQWPLRPGHHTLRLSHGQDRTLDEVRIEVRGAGLRGDGKPQRTP
ncbi:MAG: penicillin-binding protein [Pseudomonadota bacterium]